MTPSPEPQTRKTHSAHDSLYREAMALATAIRTLQWYANEDHWRENDWGVPSVIQSPDYGNPGGKARRALDRIERLTRPRP